MARRSCFSCPKRTTTSSFSVIGEELGFIGLVAVITAYLVLVYRGLRIAFNVQKQYKDRFGMLLATGITLAALGLQGFVNMSVVMGLLPTKGLTLPFISYGGSALLVDLFAVGVLLSIARGPQKSRLKSRRPVAESRGPSLMIAGGGTGGHVFAGVAVADAWRAQFVRRRRSSS